MTLKALDGHTLLMATHVPPWPPGAGNEQRIHRLLGWLRDEGVEVTLVLRAMPGYPLDARREREIARLVHRLEVVHPPRPAETIKEPAEFVRRIRALGGRARDELYNHLGGRYYTRYARPFIADKVRRLADANPGLEPLAARLAAAPPRRSAAPPVDAQRSRVDGLEDKVCPSWFLSETRRLLEELRPAAVMAQYVWMSRILEGLPPGTLKLIDCHDLSSSPSRREKVEAFGIADEFLIDPADEARLLQRADVIMAIQDGERAALERLNLGRQVITVGVDMEERPARGAAVPGRVLCVAADNAANIHGLSEFILKAWPCLRSAHPAAELHVVGRAAKHLAHFAKTPGIALVGFVPSLEDVYDAAELVINPVPAGTGLKIKTVEALAHGKPLVAWPNGVDGLDLGAGIPALIATNWLEFANAVHRLLDEPDARRDLAARALGHVRAHFSRAAAYGSLGEVLGLGGAARAGAASTRSSSASERR